MKDSFLDIYQRYCGEITDASPDYHLFMGLATLGIVLGNRVYLPWGDTRLHCNLWLVLVGESTWDRKTTSVMLAKRLLDRWKSSLIYPNEFSYERIVTMLSTRPCGGFYFSELRTFIDMMNREYMRGARSLITDLYDAPYKYERELQNQTYTIDHPAFAIMAATTLDWLIDGMKESDLSAGLFPRFLIVAPKRRSEDIPRPPMADKDKVKAMHHWFTTFSEIAGPFYLTNEANEVHDSWYHDMRKKVTGGRLDPFLGRLQGYLLKFAMLLQININQKLKITGPVMEEAVKIAWWVYDSLRGLEAEDIVTTKSEKFINAVKKRLRKNGGVMTRSELIRATHMSAKRFNETLNDMKAREEIKSYPLKQPGAKKAAEMVELLDV